MLKFPVVTGRLAPYRLNGSALHEIFNVPQTCAALVQQFRGSVPDLPRMAAKVLKATADFLASARLLRFGLQPDLASRCPVIFKGLIDLTFNDDPMLKAHWDWGFVWG